MPEKIINDISEITEDLTDITFTNTFNKKIEKGVLPNGLTRLTFGKSYNQIIKKGVLPKGLKYLKFGLLFNVKISKGVLPQGLTHLEFGECYSRINECVLPQNLVYLKLGNYYNETITRELLENLKTIEIEGRNCEKDFIDNLPATLENIIFRKLETKVDNLPVSLRRIKLTHGIEEAMKLLNKIPFGCVIVDRTDKVLLQ